MRGGWARAGAVKGLSNGKAAGEGFAEDRFDSTANYGLCRGTNNKRVYPVTSKQNTSSMRRLVAVVVTYNRLEQLRPTLARLLESPARLLEAVVVVDNASTDGTADWLASRHDARLVVHHREVNGGGAAGFEDGMRLAVARFDPDWIAVMDDDARPEPDALTAFHALPEARWDALAAAVYFPTGEICEMNRPSRNPFWHWHIFLRGN